MPRQQIEEEKVRCKPEILKNPDSLLVQEGGWARFSLRVSGYPKPRVMWIVNGNTAISVSTLTFKLGYLFNHGLLFHREIDSRFGTMACSIWIFPKLVNTTLARLKSSVATPWEKLTQPAN